MKVNGIDIKKYNAVQLTAEVLPPSLNIDYEILPGAALPTEFDTDMELGKVKLCIYFRGKDRNDIFRKMSELMKQFGKSCVLDIDGYKGRFKGYAASSDYEKMSVKNRHKLNVELDGYFYDDEIVLQLSNPTKVKVERAGSRKSPMILEVTAKAALKNYAISGINEDDIVINELAAGKTMVIDGTEGTVLIGGENAASAVDLWSFPVLDTEEKNITFSGGADVKIRYKPMWI